MTTMTKTKIEALYEALANVSEAAIPVMSRDRHIPRKEQAVLARKLFKMLGLKGIGVTVPRYSMASTVEIQLPEAGIEDGDFLLCGVNYTHHCYSDMPAELPAKQKVVAKRAAALKVEEILARAFPQHDDRSDSQSDYFDRKWSVNL